MAILYVGIDLAKNVFAVHGVDAHGKPALVRPLVPRASPDDCINDRLYFRQSAPLLDGNAIDTKPVDSLLKLSDESIARFVRERFCLTAGAALVVPGEAGPKVGRQARRADDR